MQHLFLRTLSLCLMLLSLYACKKTANEQKIQFRKYENATQSLSLEILDDDLVHIRFAGKDSLKNIPVSPMILKTNYLGATEFKEGEGFLETKNLRLEINAQSLTIKIIDKTKENWVLGEFSAKETKTLQANSDNDLQIFGLGQQMNGKKIDDFSYSGMIREGGKYGNQMMGYHESHMAGNTQMPIMYAINGASEQNYAIFLDNIYKHKWDFTQKKSWTAEVAKGDLSFYVMQGKNLPELRKSYMELVGTSPIAPKKMFGLWVSEYGFDNWAEMDDKLKTLRQNNFPVDGFVFDVQWFGALDKGKSTMGRLAWDLTRFPNPKEKLTSLRETEGIGIMNIEETYIDKKMPEYQEYIKADILVKKNGQTDLFPDTWWGGGGMFDYTNPKTGEYIHENKRKKFIDDGVMAHWLDLGEPESYNDSATYFKGTQADVHNLWNYDWAKTLVDGYEKNKNSQRLFMMGRSGSAGIHRLGFAMWSGDFGSELDYLKEQFAAQANMSLSGMDYYGSDIGGFNHKDKEKLRNTPQEQNDLYTQWFAYGCLFEIPVRVHVANVDPRFKLESAPDRMGDKKSNLDNIRNRYALTPYLYSLAYQAFTNAEPIFPPLVYYYQKDVNVFDKGNHKMIGEYLLGVGTSDHFVKTTDVYLPEGIWYDYYTNEEFKNNLYKDVPLFRNGLFKLPLYAKAGAIIPTMHIDEFSMNVLGKRLNNTQEDAIGAKIYPSAQATSFTLYEDDGQTNDYKNGKFCTTLISQELKNQQLKVSFSAKKGDFMNGSNRSLALKIVLKNNAKKVLINGLEIPKFEKNEDFAKNESGYFFENGVLMIKTTKISVEKDRVFEVQL